MKVIESDGRKILCPSDRTEWRGWLEENFETETEIHVAVPKSGDVGVIYNDAVEEALCFGWIDSVTGHLEGYSYTKRFTPRRKGSTFSRPNIERLIWLDRQGLIHPKIQPQIEPVIRAPFVFPEDILQAIRQDEAAWENYQAFPEPYKRIRVAYIDAARKRPDEFKKRLKHFIKKTRENKRIVGYGGIEKYYG